MSDKLKFNVGAADSFRSALTTAGWMDGEVEAACMVRQGESPSVASAIVGVGLFKLFKPKAAKELPRKFVLAVSGDRVVAFGAGSYSEGEGTSAVFKVSIKPGTIGEWPRSQVSVRPAKDGMTSNAVITLAGTEMPCAVPDSDAEAAFAELEAALGGGSAD